MCRRGTENKLVLRFSFLRFKPLSYYAELAPLALYMKELSFITKRTFEVTLPFCNNNIIILDCYIQIYSKILLLI